MATFTRLSIFDSLKELLLSSNESMVSLIRQVFDRFLTTGKLNRVSQYRQAQAEKYTASRPETAGTHGYYLEKAYES